MATETKNTILNRLFLEQAAVQRGKILNSDQTAVEVLAPIELALNEHGFSLVGIEVFFLRQKYLRLQALRIATDLAFHQLEDTSYTQAVIDSLPAFLGLVGQYLQASGHPTLMQDDGIPLDTELMNIVLDEYSERIAHLPPSTISI